MVALFNGVGGGAAALIAAAEFHRLAPAAGPTLRRLGRGDHLLGADRLDFLLGQPRRLRQAPGAAARPADHLRGPAGRQRRSSSRRCSCCGVLAGSTEQGIWMVLLLLGALLFGVLLVLPIGGADMPVVISLLNAFTGLAAASAGFVLENNALIIGGTLVGASGTLLTVLMGRAMNRSIANVLFGAFGAAPAGGAAAAASTDGKSYREVTADDTAVMLAYAQRSIDRARLRARGRPGPARGAGARRPPRGARRRRQVRDPPGRRPHARAHERPARRGAGALPAALRHGRHQPRVPAHGRRARHRRERRHEPGRARQPGEPALRHADPRTSTRPRTWSSSSGA